MINNSIRTRSFMLLCTVIIVFAFPQNSLKEKNASFDTFCQTVKKNEKKRSSEQIIHIGDSLYKASSDNWQQVSSSFVIIQGYEMQNNWNKALKVALRADSIAQKKSLILLKPRTTAVLGSLYSNLGLYNKSIDYLSKAEQFADHLNKEEALVNKSLIYQRISAVYQNQKNYDKALTFNLKALNIIESLKKEFPSNDYATTQTPVLLNLGVNYHNLGQYELSKKYYRKGFKSIIGSENNFYLSYFYIKYAANEIKLKNADSALFYIEKSKFLASKFEDKTLQFEIDSRLSEYYFLKNDIKKSDSIKNKLLEHYKDKTQSEMLAIQDIIHTNERKIVGESRNTSIFIVISAILAIVSLLLYFFHQYQKKKIKIHFEKIIQDFQNGKLLESKASQKKEDNTASKKTQLPEKKIEELLQRLDIFEKKNEFTTKNLTISNMASLFKTNTKYISYILQEYRGMNFNDYLNQVRIKFIVQKMINHPEYLNYKIDYLAEVSGYSSHSRFAQMFKKEIKLSPSEFISQLNKNPQTNN